MLLQRQPCHLVQQDKVVIVGGNFQPQYGREIEREVGHKTHCQRTQRNILQIILVLQEVEYMLACGQIADVGMPCTVNAHTLGVFLVMLVKQ